MNASPAEIGAARAILEEVGADDAATLEVLGRMRETVGALRSWADDHARLPKPRLARPWSIRPYIAAASAAAVVMLALSAMVAPLSSSRPAPRIDPQELAWTGDRPGKPGSTQGDPPGAPGGRPQGAAPRWPGGFALAASTRVPPDRLRLAFEAGDRTFSMFVNRSAGPDTSFQEVVVGGRTLVCKRKSGILVSFDPSPVDERDWETWVTLALGEMK